MKHLHDDYTREIHTALGYFAAWPPGAAITLGDVGLVSGRRFRRKTSLTELGVDFAVSSPTPIGDLEYATKGSVDVSSTAGGEVPGTAAAKVLLNFSASGATFFQASGCATQTIVNLPALGRVLTRKHEWNRRYVVITEVVRSGPIVVLVSSERGATAELHASATPTESPLLGAARTGLDFTVRKGFAAHLASDSGASPLFQAMSLRKRPNRGGTMEYRNEVPPEDQDTRDMPTGFVLRRLTWDEFAAEA
ncbi:hypothetical protein [Amycolatopsis vastitatis]|uniref:Uncharacterized protein n=1 Tax=Amycolatopsis vastitatis TaxID=1905142 RepID=A0A229SL67_9PSEU|nr:hypothetical protein [Amycolatopsis vastitatis]OXM59727.1 hypothetical protein CF165_46320 [Amycolatopsis vastitatis]